MPAVLLVDAETGRVLAALPPLLDGGGTQPAAPLHCLAFLADGLHLVRAVPTAGAERGAWLGFGALTTDLPVA